MHENVRYYEIAGITVQVESDLPLTDATFHDKFKHFRVDQPGSDMVTIHHHFGLPDPLPTMDESDEAKEVYRKPPWAIRRTPNSWVYLGIDPDPEVPAVHRAAVFSLDHSRGDFYNNAAYEEAWLAGGLTALTMFPSDQIFLARLLADRVGCFLHSGAAKIDGQGLAFIGHSSAGKSTTIELLRAHLGDRAEILCDDRNVVRRWSGRSGEAAPGFYVHGTWSHGDVPEVSSVSAPLRAILFLEQHPDNEIVPLVDRKLVYRRLLATLIKPLVTAEWWTKELDVLEQIVADVPSYTMRFDKSGAIVAELEMLVH